MTKILVVSDTHGNKDNLKKLVQSDSFEYVLFLGDCLSDVQGITTTNLCCVKGNWDIDFKTPNEAILNVEGVNIFFTHGHKYSVKSGLGGLVSVAKKENCNLVCYGHTHIQNYVQIDGIGFLNPGAFSNFKGGKCTYAVVEINNKNFNVNMLNYLK